MDIEANELVFQDIEHAASLWNFLAPHQLPETVDAIFVFGGVNLRVPSQAAELYKAQYSSTLLVSGGAGSRTHLHFDIPEAEAFVRVLNQAGVPSNDIIVETKASNTGQNVEFGMSKLLARFPDISSLLLVATPFIMRRCIATFKQQYPQVRVIPCPPVGGYQDFVDRPISEFINRLVGEVDRLDMYSESGFIVPVSVPPAVRQACEYFRVKSGSVSR